MTPPALTRHPHRPIPLLPSGPGGIFDLASRGADGATIGLFQRNGPPGGPLPNVAERAGFEPAKRGLAAYTLSRRAPSTARTPLRWNPWDGLRPTFGPRILAPAPAPNKRGRSGFTPDAANPHRPARSVHASRWARA